VSNLETNESLHEMTHNNRIIQFVIALHDAQLCVFECVCRQFALILTLVFGNFALFLDIKRNLWLCKSNQLEVRHYGVRLLFACQPLN
jgi:hypothetical protein